MSLFQCEHCGCVENTALTGGYLTFNHRAFQWDGIEDRRNKRLCSACCPSTYRDGTKCSKGGKWHGQFARVFLPMGEWETNKGGNLQHKVTKTESYRDFAIRIEDVP